MVKNRRYLILVLVSLALGGCRNVAPDHERGETLFRGEADPGVSNVLTCISCHPTAPGSPGDIGPNLSNIGNRAGSTVAGQSAEAYLRMAIVDPDAYLAGGFQEGIMYRQYKDVLTSAQIGDLVAYMMTLQSGVDE